MAKRTSLGGLEESALAAMLGLPLGELQRMLGAIRPLRRSGTERWFDWHDIKARLTGDVLESVRRQLAQKRRILRPSKRWVGGYPDLVAQWDWRRNVNVLPDDVSFGSHLQIWWRCENGPDHRWSARAQSRTGGKGCPFCAGKLVSVTNSLAARSPAVASQWHLTKNGARKPDDFVWSSNSIVWWKCTAGPDHEWRARINGRTSGAKGCPFCAGNRPSTTNSLASVLPDLGDEWHRELNRHLAPDGVTACSNRRVWWRCRKDPSHVWKAVIQSRTKGAGCPFCSGNRVSFSNCLAFRKPEIAKQWHPTRNAGSSPRYVTWRSSKEVWWKCPRGTDHVWRTRIASRTSRGVGCPCCEGRHPS